MKNVNKRVNSLVYNGMYAGAEGCDKCKKKLIVSRQPIFVNLNSNTMKNTVQRYGFFLICQEFAPCFLLRLTNFINLGTLLPLFCYFFITISQRAQSKWSVRSMLPCRRMRGATRFLPCGVLRQAPR